MQIVYHGSYCKVEEPKLLDNKYTNTSNCLLYR